MVNTAGWIQADWPAPPHIRAGSSTRSGGVSKDQYATLNLALHVGDSNASVQQNRQLLCAGLSLPAEPCWLQQVHGNRVTCLDRKPVNREADAGYTRGKGKVCAVLTADCLPLLLCDQAGSEIAAVHVGWRGLCANIISRSLDMFTCKNNEILAWLGPAISARYYETGDEVRDACLDLIAGAESAFLATRPGHWLTDLPELARLQLLERGVNNIHGGGYCTWSNPSLFYSCRRDGVSGRFASLIWMDS